MTSLDLAFGATGLLDQLPQRTRVIAWDAPGYGTSTPLPMDAPRGADYAQRLHEMLDALGVSPLPAPLAPDQHLLM